MPLIYVTGIAGSGKSEAYKELKARGYTVYGTDEDRLAGFYHNETGERLQHPPEDPNERTPEWRERYTYRLPRSVIEKLKSQSEGKTIFICGVAANEEEYLDLFDELIALVIDEGTLRERVHSRTTNNFGKTESEFAGILEWQAETDAYYNKYSYTCIDATQPVRQVVDDILHQLTMTDREFFALSKNGVRVTYDPIHSHASTHFADTPQIRPFVKRIIENTDISGDIMEFDADTGEALGTSDLVETDESDVIVYAIRKNRDRHMRFTKSRQSQPSSMVAVSLNRLDGKTYDLYSAWLGPQTPPTPNSPHANPESKPFWSKHALVWGNQEIQPGTETRTCPW